VGNELPNAGNGEGANGDATQDAVTTEEVVNYEISRTTRTQVQQAGALRRLSVAVLVDGTYSQGENGEMVYAPRSDEELNQITALVRSAVGFNESRGDTIEVANLQFAETPVDLAAAETGSMLPPMNMNDYFYIAEIAVLTILAILVLLLVVRPLVRQIIEGEQGPQAATATQAALPAAEGETQLITDQTQEEARPEPEIEWIKQAQIAGEVQQAAISQVGTLVNENPDEAIGVLRQWMQEAT
jgi:flagellar M-ring protein FliF